MEQVFHGQVDGTGRLTLTDRGAFQRMLGGLKHAYVDLIVRQRRRRRSNRQNAFYWSVVVGLLAEHCGYQPDEMHDALRWKFLRLEADSALPTVRSTTSLSTLEFEAYVENVRTWAGADLGVNIPEPNEVEI